MSLFDKPIDEIRAFCKNVSATGRLESLVCIEGKTWPKGGDRNFVLKQDTAVELGHPKTESISFSVWTNRLNEIRDGVISLIGPPLDRCDGKRIPFGQIIILGIEEAGIEDDYQVFRRLEEVKYQIDLQGYMRRGVSQFLREWSRISREALQLEFSFQTLGQELFHLYRQVEFVKSVEIIFISELQPLLNIKPMAKQVLRIIAAMNKMLNEEMLDCDDCDYSDICSEVEELKKMRKQKKETGVQ